MYSVLLQLTYFFCVSIFFCCSTVSATCLSPCTDLSSSHFCFQYFALCLIRSFSCRKCSTWGSKFATSCRKWSMALSVLEMSTHSLLPTLKLFLVVLRCNVWYVFDSCSSLARRDSFSSRSSAISLQRSILAACSASSLLLEYHVPFVLCYLWHTSILHVINQWSDPIFVLCTSHSGT